MGGDLDDGIPARLHRVGRAGQARLVLLVAGHRARPPHLPGPVTAVPAHPERGDPERRRGRRRVQRDRLARQHAGLSGVAHHRVRRAQVPDVPARVTRQRVFRDQPPARAGSRSRPGGGWSGVTGAAPGRGGQGTDRTKAEEGPSAGPALRTAAVPGHGRQDAPARRPAQARREVSQLRPRPVQHKKEASRTGRCPGPTCRKFPACISMSTSSTLAPPCT